MITVCDDFNLAVRIGVGAGLYFYFWLFRAFLHVIHSDILALQVFSYRDLLLSVVFSLDNKLVDLDVSIGCDCS